VVSSGGRDVCAAAGGILGVGPPTGTFSLAGATIGFEAVGAAGTGAGLGKSLDQAKSVIRDRAMARRTRFSMMLFQLLWTGGS
jgi:hypothetical protein